MSNYWTVSKGKANHTGHTCRECRGTIFSNEPICVRDGRKIRLFYHENCFSGDADPRTQGSSSYSDKSWRIRDKAPVVKGRGKWWTSEYGYRGHVVAPALMNLGPSSRASSGPSAALRRPSAVVIDQFRAEKLVAVERRKQKTLEPSSSPDEAFRVDDAIDTSKVEQSLTCELSCMQRVDENQEKSATECRLMEPAVKRYFIQKVKRFSR